MNQENAFAFDGGSVSTKYDKVLVPLMFDAWAELLLDRVDVSGSLQVLDLATGSGIVAEKLAARLAVDSRVVGADISPGMLALARERCADFRNVEFMETPAVPLALPDNSFDLVICQQGFQFFEDRPAAAREMHRVLKPGGRVAVATWCPLELCTAFGIMRDALQLARHDEAADMLGLPFDHLSRDELSESFVKAGFADIETEQVQRELVYAEGSDQVWNVLWATPVAQRLQALGEKERRVLRAAVNEAVSSLSASGNIRGHMVSNFLFASKP